MCMLGAKDPAIIVAESSDHISTLPNDVLYNIFADFQILELVQCSLLSKRWRHFWICMPYLNFDQSQFTSIQAREGKFIEFITYVLLSQGESNIKTLRITSNEQIDGLIASMWIQIADMRNVQTIDLNITPWSLAIVDSLLVPCLAFRKLLLVLKLNLNYQRIQINMSCEQLKTLHLVAVALPSTNFVEEIFKGCPLIEDFKIERCMFHVYKVLEIFSNNLKNFVFVNDLWETLRLHGSFEGVLKVVAPKLMTFVYCGWSVGSRSNASDLRLTIPKSQNQFLGWEEKRCFAPQFYNLKQLELFSGFRCHMSTVHLLKYFPSLEALAINAGWEEAIPCLKYHLKKINIINASRD